MNFETQDLARVFRGYKEKKNKTTTIKKQQQHRYRRARAA